MLEVLSAITRGSEGQADQGGRVVQDDEHEVCSSTPKRPLTRGAGAHVAPSANFHDLPYTRILDSREHATRASGRVVVSAERSTHTVLHASRSQDTDVIDRASGQSYRRCHVSWVTREVSGSSVAV